MRPFVSGFIGRVHATFFRGGRRDKGHVSILFAVSMLFLAALAFFVLSAGRRYLQKEAVQGAADAAAFAAAAAEAKTFNTVAFINLMMAIGVAMVYTLQGVMGGFIAAMATVGPLCIFLPEDCAFLPEDGELVGRYAVAATQLAERLKPLENAARQVAKMGPVLVTLEAEKAGMHDAYTGQAPGLLVVLKPPISKLPLKDGRVNEVCGNAGKDAEAGAALWGIAQLDLPLEIPPITRGLVASEGLAADALAGLANCEGETGLKPQTLTDDWYKETHVESIAVLADSKQNSRRAYLKVAGDLYGDAGAAPPNYVIGTAKADVYGADGLRGEDMWHMDWRGRLVLSKPGDFLGLNLPNVLNSLWVH